MSPIGADCRPTRAGASPAPTIYGLARLLRRMVGATLAVALALQSAPMGVSPSLPDPFWDIWDNCRRWDTCLGWDSTLFSAILAAAGGEGRKKRDSGDTPDPGREALPPAPT